MKVTVELKGDLEFIHQFLALGLFYTSNNVKFETDQAIADQALEIIRQGRVPVISLDHYPGVHRSTSVK